MDNQPLKEKALSEFRHQREAFNALHDALLKILQQKIKITSDQLRADLAIANKYALTLHMAFYSTWFL